jgi:molecular chaperone GrpE
MSDQPEKEYMEQQDVAANDAPQADYEAFMRLVKENEDLKDRALRLAAEMENLRRRTQRDVADARTYAVTNFARDMLTVSDNLRRALDAVGEEAKANADPSFKSLIDGVDITERGLLSSLERHGVKQLSPHGRKVRSEFPSGDL